MSIYSHLSNQQVDKIISIIRTQCDEAAREDRIEILRLGSELYKKLKTARKTHDITGKINYGFFYRENRIEGLELSYVRNGVYYQPELRTEDAIIHIYHKSNRLNSGLIRDRKREGKHFFCFQFSVNQNNRLQSITVVEFYGETKEEETIYTALELVEAVG